MYFFSFQAEGVLTRNLNINSIDHSDEPTPSAYKDERDTDDSDGKVIVVGYADDDDEDGPSIHDPQGDFLAVTK